MHAAYTLGVGPCPAMPSPADRRSSGRAWTGFAIRSCRPLAWIARQQGSPRSARRRRRPQPNKRDEPRPAATVGRCSRRRPCGTSPLPQASKFFQHGETGRASRVEEGRGIAHATRLPSPLIKPDVRISRIRLSDWLHREHTASGDMSDVHVPASPWHRDTVPSAKFGSRWCLQAHRQSPHLVRFEHAPEVRVLPSTGVTRLQQYYDPVRLPHEPMPLRTVEAATLVQRGSPPLAQPPVSTCRAPYPGGPIQVHLSAASPDRAAFPELRAGRRPQLPFRGLLRLHTRYGPSIRSAARGGVCRRASMRPVTQPHRLPATGPTDHCPDGTCTHKVITPFGAHRRTTEKASMALRAKADRTPREALFCLSPWSPWLSLFLRAERLACLIANRAGRHMVGVASAVHRLRYGAVRRARLVAANGCGVVNLPYL